MHITIIYNTYIYLHTLILTSQNVSDMYSMMVVPPMRSLSLSHSLSLSLSRSPATYFVLEDAEDAEDV